MRILFLVMTAFFVYADAIYAQDAKRKFTVVELESMAKMWFAGYWTGRQSHNFLHNQIGSAQDSPTWTVLDNYQNDLLVDTSDIDVLGYLNENGWKDRIVIFNLSSPEIHWSSYKIAMSFRGTLYRLSGFDENDLNSLIHNEFSQLDSEQSLIDVASFIASHVNIEKLGSVETLKTDNISDYVTYYAGLYPPSVDTLEDVNLIVDDNFVRDVYRVRLFTVHGSDEKELRLYNVEFANGRLLDCKSVVVATWH